MEVYYWDKSNCTCCDNFYGTSCIVVTADSEDHAWMRMAEQAPSLYMRLIPTCHLILGCSENKEHELHASFKRFQNSLLTRLEWERIAAKYVFDKLVSETGKPFTKDSPRPSKMHNDQVICGLAYD